MPRHAEGHALEQIGAVALAQGADRLSCGRKNGRQIIAVDGLRGDAVGRGETAHVLDVGVLLTTRELGVAVVLADEQHRQSPQGGKIQRLVERARARRPIAKKDDADVLSALRLRGPRGARGERQIARHDAGRAQYAVRRVDQVHRAAAPAAQAGLPSQNFGESRLHIAALGKHVAMPAVTRKQHVLAAQLRADTDGDGFLPGRQVRESGDLARGCEPLNVTLEQAYAPERAVHLLPVSQRWFGHEAPHDVVHRRHRQRCDPLFAPDGG